MRLNTGRTPSFRRWARTSASVTPPVIALSASWTMPEPPRRRLAHPPVHVGGSKRQLRQAPVGKAHRLQPPHLRRHPAAGRRCEPAPPASTISCQPLQEPGVEPGDLVDPLDREALPQRLGGDQQPVRRRLGQRILDLVRDRRLQALARGRGRKGRSPARAAPSAGSRRRSGRSPSLRRPTSSPCSEAPASP